jgi:hypothetical protein
VGPNAETQAQEGGPGDVPLNSGAGAGEGEDEGGPAEPEEGDGQAAAAAEGAGPARAEAPHRQPAGTRPKRYVCVHSGPARIILRFTPAFFPAVGPMQARI